MVTKEMNPAFFSLYILLLISIPAVLFLGFQPNLGSEEVSDGVLGVVEFKRFKILLGSSPAQPLHYHSAPLKQPSSAQRQKDGRSETKVSFGLSIIILAVFGGIVSVVFFILLVLACRRYRSQRTMTLSRTRSRVSTIPSFKRDGSFKQAYGSKTMSSKESLQSSPSQTMASAPKWEADSVSLLSGEIVPMESTNSDEESLFSIGNSNSAFGVSNFSPSPSCRVTRFPPPKPPLPPLMASPSSSRPSFSNAGVSRPVPPPMPPPFSKGSNSSHPLPPPPCQIQPCRVAGKDVAPLPKLKPLHWDKVRGPSDQIMVWDKIKCNSFEFDEEMIEELFGYNSQSLARDRELKSKSSAASDRFIEPKRLQNITILIKTLNASSEHVCDALMQGTGLSVQQLEALLKISPMKEEEEKLSNYKEDVSRLGSTEIFLKQLLDIPFSFLRIEAMLFKETFEDETSLIRQSVAMIEEACKELKSSRLFLRLLEAVLKAGNRMNVGTIRGGAKAFKLDTLLKLADVKGIDGKTTLLHFVVQEIIRSPGSQHQHQCAVEMDCKMTGLNLVSGISSDLGNVKKTANVDLNELATSISNLNAAVNRLKSLLVHDSSINDGNGTFFSSMKCFLNHAEQILTELKNDEQAALQHVKELTEYFHGDMSKKEANPLRIFVTVSEFLVMLDRVCKEL